MVDKTPSFQYYLSDISRRSLSRRVCELLSWRRPDGRLKDMSCRKALSHLHKTGNLQMPDAAHDFAFNRRVLQKEFVRSQEIYTALGVTATPGGIKKMAV